MTSSSSEKTICITKTSNFGITLPTQKDNILKSNQCIKSDKTPCIIYGDCESLIKETYNCKNSPEKV